MLPFFLNVVIYILQHMTISVAKKVEPDTQEIKMLRQ
jgi:hypothetical protein